MQTPGAALRAHAVADATLSADDGGDECTAGQAAMDGILRSLLAPSAARDQPAVDPASTRPGSPGQHLGRHRSPGADSPREVIAGLLIDAGVHPTEAASYAAQVCRAFRGCLVRFHVVSTDHTQRDEAVRTSRAAGASLGTLAQRFRLSRTHVRRICREL